MALLVSHVEVLIYDVFKNRSNFANDTPLNQSLLKLLKAIQEGNSSYVKEISEKLEKNSGDGEVWKKYLISKFLDSGSIINLYQDCISKSRENQYGQISLKKKILRKHQDFNKVIFQKWKLPIERINFPTVDDEYLHCEMQAMEHNYFSSNPINPLLIGISKLSCFMCWLVCKISNENHQNIKVFVRGTHGKQYLGWKLPTNLRNLDKIKKKLRDIFTQNLRLGQKLESDDPMTSSSECEGDCINLVHKSLILQVECAYGIILKKLFPEL